MEVTDCHGRTALARAKQRSLCWRANRLQCRRPPEEMVALLEAALETPFGAVRDGAVVDEN